MRKTEICDPMNQMAAGSRMEKPQALIPNVGSGQGRQCGRDHTMLCCEERTCVCKIESKICTERERERETQRGISLLTKYATVTK